MPPRVANEFALLADVRKSLRSLNSAIAKGASGAGLTLQQQAFLLALAAGGGRRVRLADIRNELAMDRATASEMLQRLVEMRLLQQDVATDKRASDISFTNRGRKTFLRSVTTIRHELAAAQRRGALSPLQGSLDGYFRYYLPGARPRPRRTARQAGRSGDLDDSRRSARRATSPRRAKGAVTRRAR